MATFEEVLNTIIPFALVISGIAFVWWKAKDPLTSLFEWLTGLFASSSDKVVTTYQGTKEIVYDI